MPQFKFPKANKLCSRDGITRVFSLGKTAKFYPLLFRYLNADEPQAVRILVSAPKKRYKRAVVRNRLKRLMREAYRLEQHLLDHALQNGGLHIACSYIGPAEADFATVRQAMNRGLAYLSRHATEPTTNGNEHDEQPTE